MYTVTGVPQSMQDDQDERMRRYLISMGIRTLCFILAVVFIVILHWTIIGWVMVGGAVVLPYIAVVMANATRSRRTEYMAPVPPVARSTPELGRGQEPLHGTAEHGRAIPPGSAERDGRRDDRDPRGPRGGT